MIERSAGLSFAVELRSFLELIVVEVARPAGQRQDLRDQVEIDGPKNAVCL